MSEPVRLLVLAGASFAAAFLSACFSVGGGYVLFGATTWILPLPSAIALQSVLSFGSLFSRIHAFRHDIDWPIVRSFTAGSIVGVGAGMWLFNHVPESLLAGLLGLLLLALAWAPPMSLGMKPGASFFSVGVLHAVSGSVFGLGAILQPALLRAGIARIAIVGTFAMCIVVLEVLRTLGYALSGFVYARYLPEIAVATITGFAGTYLGKHSMKIVPDEVFQHAMRLFVTALGLRFLYRGVAVLLQW